MDRIYESAIKYAAFNAHQHSGKAQVGSVMGRIFAEYPNAKTNAKDVQNIVISAINEVNTWSYEKQTEYAKKFPELFDIKKVEVRKKMPPLKGLERFISVKVRFAPNPDGPLHLGSAEPIIFSDEYAKMYRGRFILRYEDTSADVKPPILKMYDWIKEDLIWLGVNIDEIYYQSDRLEIYYEYAEKLLTISKAYVCTCPSHSYKELYMAKKACPCRLLPPEENLKRWKDMLNKKYKRGEAVVRIKTDIEHPNPAIRDWPALRISTREHPRVGKKFRVWPLYNFSCAIDDHIMGISHVIRGKEHEMNSARQRYIFEYFGWVFPEVINVGRLGVEAGILSKSKIRAGVDSGIYSGWDDPRLGTLRALKRRGLQPEAIRELMIQVGPKPINIMLSWGNIAATNKKIVEPIASRYYFVKDPVEVEVSGLPEEMSAKLARHPDHLDRGFREHSIKPRDGRVTFFLSAKDVIRSRGKIIRLMGLANIDVGAVGDKVEAVYHSKEHNIAKELDVSLVQWLLKKDSIAAEVIMPDFSKALGIAEKECGELKPDTIIQFERFGFVRVDKNDPFVAYYSHD